MNATNTWRRIGYFFGWVMIVVLWAVAVTGFHHILHWPVIVSVILFCILPLIGWRLRNPRIFVAGAVITFLGMIICVLCLYPSNDRDWAIEFSVLPKVDITGERVKIEGFRNFKWNSAQTFDPVWENRSYDLGKLQSLELIVEPFKDSDYMAHTMLRFGFGDEGYLIVSVEARREKHERYSLVKGAFRQFELIYLFGSEDDLLALRAVHRGTRLYAYPIKADRTFMVHLFKGLASSANALHTKPQFYRSIRDNCTTTLVHHFDRQQKEHIGLRLETLFPALTGRLLYQMGYMDTNLSYEEAMKVFRIDEEIRTSYKTRITEIKQQDS